jgi:hypothetical protein
MYALGVLGKSLGMLIAKGYSCNCSLGVNSVADATIYNDLVGDKFCKDIIARVVLGDEWSWLPRRMLLFSRTPVCK